MAYQVVLKRRAMKALEGIDENLAIPISGLLSIHLSKIPVP